MSSVQQNDVYRQYLNIPPLPSSALKRKRKTNDLAGGSQIAMFPHISKIIVFGCCNSNFQVLAWAERIMYIVWSMVTVTVILYK